MRRVAEKREILEIPAGSVNAPGAPLLRAARRNAMRATGDAAARRAVYHSSAMSLADALPPVPSLDALRSTVGEDWADVNRTIVRRLGSDVALVNQVAHHIIHNGGKRLRPLAVLLAARACGCRGPAPIASAAIIEFIHTATLLHDDVVDGSGLRRGRQTANALFGNQASVLVGDCLLYTSDAADE